MVSRDDSKSSESVDPVLGAGYCLLLLPLLLVSKGRPDAQPMAEPWHFMARIADAHRMNMIMIQDPIKYIPYEYSSSLSVLLDSKSANWLECMNRQLRNQTFNLQSIVDCAGERTKEERGRCHHNMMRV